MDGHNARLGRLAKEPARARLRTSFEMSRTVRLDVAFMDREAGTHGSS
jgi:hypothetical protein